MWLTFRKNYWAIGCINIDDNIERLTYIATKYRPPVL